MISINDYPNLDDFLNQLNQLLDAPIVNRGFDLEEGVFGKVTKLSILGLSIEEREYLKRFMSVLNYSDNVSYVNEIKYLVERLRVEEKEEDAIEYENLKEVLEELRSLISDYVTSNKIYVEKYKKILPLVKDLSNLLQGL